MTHASAGTIVTITTKTRHPFCRRCNIPLRLGDKAARTGSVSRNAPHHYCRRCATLINLEARVEKCAVQPRQPHVRLSIREDILTSINDWKRALDIP